MKERSLTGPICQAAACRNLSPPSVRGWAAISSSRGEFIMFQDFTGPNSVYTSMPRSDVPKSERLRRILSRWGWKSPTKPQSPLTIRATSPSRVLSKAGGLEPNNWYQWGRRCFLFLFVQAKHRRETQTYNMRGAWKLLWGCWLYSVSQDHRPCRLVSQYSSDASSLQKSETQPTFSSAHPAPGQDWLLTVHHQERALAPQSQGRD